MMPSILRIPAAVLAIGGGLIVLMYSDPAAFDLLIRAWGQVMQSIGW